MSRALIVAGGLAAIAGLVAANLLMASEPLDSAPLVTASSAMPGAVLAGGAPVIEARSFSITHTRSRPLFSAERRMPVAPPPPPPPKQQPPPPEPAVVAAPPPPPPDIRLYGVQITPSGSRALVTHGNSFTPEWVAEGAEIRGWSLSAVSAGGVELRSGDRRQTIDLYPADRQE